MKEPLKPLAAMPPPCSNHTHPFVRETFVNWTRWMQSEYR